MKYLPVLLAFLFSPALFSQDLEWAGRLEIDSVDFPGHRSVLIQHYLTPADSLIANGSVTFSNASLRDVGNCSYKMRFADTVLVEAEITVRGRKASQELMDYFELLSGKDPDPDMNQGGFEFIPVRIIEHGGVPVVMELKRKRMQRKTILILTSETAVMLHEILEGRNSSSDG